MNAFESISVMQCLTISKSCSCRAKASSLLSIHDAAATSRGVDPRIPDNTQKILLEEIQLVHIPPQTIHLEKPNLFSLLIPTLA